MNRWMTKYFLIGFLYVILAHSFPAGAQIGSEEQLNIRLQVEEALLKLDASGQKLDNSEYVRRLYWHFLKRLPTEEEEHNVVDFLRGDVEIHVDLDGRTHECKMQLKRSKLYLHFLREKFELKDGFDYDWLKSKFQTEFDKYNELSTLPNDLPPYSADNTEETNLLQSYAPPLRLNKPEAGTSYSNYFGNVHGHTIFSADAVGTPPQAYRKTKREGLHFFGTSEHALHLSWLPWGFSWWLSRAIADYYNEPHTFVTLYAYEWSSVLYGHINVIGTADLTTALPIHTDTPKKLYAWLDKREEAIGRFNHPGRVRVELPGDEFDHFKGHRPKGKRNMVGIEVFNKSKNIHQYLHGNKGFDHSTNSNYFEEALNLGWDLGMAGGQDDHQAEWGDLLKHAVTAIWATELTRKGVYDAYKNRRTYATEDRNRSLSFKIDGNEMGSRLTVPTSKNVQAVIDLKDPDPADQNIDHIIKLYKNGDDPAINTTTVHPNGPPVTWTLTPEDGDYYYVVVFKKTPVKEFDYAVSSPIWFQQ